MSDISDPTQSAALLQKVRDAQAAESTSPAPPPSPQACTAWEPVLRAQPLLCKACGGTFESHDNPYGKPESCRVCTLYHEPGPVWGTGPEDANLAVVGEAPGADEVDEPRRRRDHFAPFIGGAGRLLSALLAHAHLRRSELWITNAVRCRPPSNRTPTPHEIACCYPLLRAELRVIKPNVVVAAGETAFNALTGKKGIGTYRGVPTRGFDELKVQPTWHPAFIARAQYNWPFAVHDLARAAAERSFPELRRVPYSIIRTATAATHGAALLADARARKGLTFDFETTGLSPKLDRILMLGVAARSDQAQVYDWSAATAELFQTILNDPEIEVVGQNILYYDLPFAEAQGINIDKAWLKAFDTMVAFHLCNASYGQTSVYQQATGQRARGMEKDLTMIASCHTDIEYWKSRENYRHDLRMVCGTDCIATDRSALDPVNGLKAELRSLNMTDLYYKHVLPVHPVLHSMTTLGVRIDEDRAIRWSAKLEANADELERVLKEGLGDPFLNINSPKQLITLLYEKLRLPVQYMQDPKTRQFKPTANAEALETLARLAPENAVLGTLVNIRQMRKLKTTFLDRALLEGRVHPRFGVCKTANGRFNSWDPNAQNVPEIVRETWIPDDPEEEVLIVGDYSQIEWRLAMVLSGDPVGLELLASGVDNHAAIFAESFGKKLGENKNGTCNCGAGCAEHVTDQDRHAAKFIVYGLGYGRGADSLAKGHRPSAWSDAPRAALDPAFVKTFISRFFRKFAVYADWREQGVRFADRNGYLVNPFNRRRWWYGRGAPTEQYNFRPSSTAADMMHVVLVLLHAQLPKGATLRLTVHDEIVVNAAKSVAKEAFHCMRSIMQQTWPVIEAASARPENVRRFYPQGWFCPVELHVGANWKQAKSKDPQDAITRKELERSLGL